MITISPVTPSVPSVGIPSGLVSGMVPVQQVAFNLVEQSGAIFRAAVTDENGSACSASAMAWSLTDEAGNVINGRQNVSLLGSGSAVTFIVALGEADTARQASEVYIAGAVYLRVLHLFGWYNSPTTGGPLPITGAYTFALIGVPLESP